MPSVKLTHKPALKTGNRQKICCLAVSGLLGLATAFDYGKHWILKNTLEKEIEKSGVTTTAGSLTVSLCPLLQSCVVLKNFHVKAIDASFIGLPSCNIPVEVKEIHVRQGWRNWNLAHIHALRIKGGSFLEVQEAKGTLDIQNLASRINVTHLLLSSLNVTLPALNLSGKEASFEFLYDIKAHHLWLKADAPDLSFSNGVTFGFSGEGNLSTFPALKGEMPLKIRNIHKLASQLVHLKIIGATESRVALEGSSFLDSLGIHDMTLPLTVDAGSIFLGPVPLLKIR